MNLVLLTPNDFIDEGRARLEGRRFRHIQAVLGCAHVGARLKVGQLGGLIGGGEVVYCGDDFLELKVVLNSPPPPALPLTVLLALPRPKMLKRCLQHLTALGVKKIILLNSFRVEKSFWQSLWLHPDKLHEQLLLGLEQARDTVLPEVILEKRFKPFVEDRLPQLMVGKRGLVAHPVGAEACPRQLSEPAVLAIGSEGGFIPYEVSRLEEAGFAAITTGPRILRVETAVTALVSRLYDG